MGDVFNGWRLKIGLLTLLMAVVLSGSWIRSLSVEDTILLHRESKTILVRFSENGSAEFCVSRRSYPSTKMTKRLDWVCRKVLMGDLSLLDLAKGFGESNYGFEFDYWSITIPLTLFSLWLFVSHSHKPNQTAIPDSLTMAGT